MSLLKHSRNQLHTQLHTQLGTYDLTPSAQYTQPTTESPGNLITPTGEILGPHNGLWHYTIGQRARLPSKEERWFVARKGVGESKKDVLVVPGAYVLLSKTLKNLGC